MTFSYNNQHGPKEVRQSLLVSVEGNKVVVNGASPVVLRGSAGYNADNFFLTVVNARMMKGYNKDVNGTGGTVVLSR